MTIRAYLIIMTCVSACAWLAWFVILEAIDPTKSGSLGFLLFFLTLGMAFLSSVTLLGTLVRIWMNNQEVVYRQVIRSLRQGSILTILFLTSLALSGQGLLVWWVLILLVLISTFLELFFLGSNAPS